MPQFASPEISTACLRNIRRRGGGCRRAPLGPAAAARPTAGTEICNRLTCVHTYSILAQRIIVAASAQLSSQTVRVEPGTRLLGSLVFSDGAIFTKFATPPGVDLGQSSFHGRDRFLQSWRGDICRMSCYLFYLWPRMRKEQIEITGYFVSRRYNSLRTSAKAIDRLCASRIGARLSHFSPHRLDLVDAGC